MRLHSSTYRCNKSHTLPQSETANGSAIQMQRLRFSCICIVAGIAGICLSGYLLNQQGEIANGASPYNAIESSRLMDYTDPFQVLDNVDALLSSDEGQLSDEYISEIGILNGAFSTKSYCSSSVVGYSVHGSNEAVVSQLEEEMKNRGWRSIAMSGMAGISFNKDSGRFRWALITVDQFDSVSTVVVRCF